MAIFKKENGQLVDFSNPIPDTSIAPIENGATSTHNYVVGAYALVKGILKKVTNAISIGTAFSDSNSETTDVATELKELNDDVTTINTHLSNTNKVVCDYYATTSYPSTTPTDVTTYTITESGDYDIRIFVASNTRNVNAVVSLYIGSDMVMSCITNGGEVGATASNNLIFSLNQGDVLRLVGFGYAGNQTIRYTGIQVVKA